MSEVTHTVRCGDGGKKTVTNYTRNTAIKTMCTECMGWSANPKACTDKMCPLYPYRAKTKSTLRGDDDEKV